MRIADLSRATADTEDFRAGLRGQLLLPGAAGYDDARLSER